MRRQIIISGLVLSVLTGCSGLSQSRLNPLNWFGKSQPIAHFDAGNQAIILPTLAPRNGYPVLIETRPLTPNIATLRIEKTSTGAIITASSDLPSIGYFDAELVPVGDVENGVLTLEFRLRTPTSPRQTGTAAQRRVTVARSISRIELQSISRIIVHSASGSRQVRR